MATSRGRGTRLYTPLLARALTCIWKTHAYNPSTLAVKATALQGETYVGRLQLNKKQYRAHREAPALCSYLPEALSPNTFTLEAEASACDTGRLSALIAFSVAVRKCLAEAT